MRPNPRTPPRDPLTLGRKAAGEPRTRKQSRRGDLPAWLTPRRQKVIRATRFSISIEDGQEKIHLVGRRCFEEFETSGRDLSDAARFMSLVRELRNLAVTHDCVTLRRAGTLDREARLQAERAEPPVAKPKKVPLSAVLGPRFHVEVREWERPSECVVVRCRRCGERWWLPRYVREDPTPFTNIRDHRCRRRAPEAA